MFEINPSAQKPTYVQIAEQVKLMMATGKLKKNAKLPSIRKVAEDLGIDQNTVAKAYKELEREGLVRTKRGGGVYIGEQGSLFEKEEKMTQQELEQYLWRAADILRGPIEVSEYKNYILTLLFYKRLSDVYLEEYHENLKKYKDKTIAKKKFHRFLIPEGCLWEDLREVGTNIGQRLNDALEKITKTNPELEGVLNRTDFARKEFLTEQRIVKLMEHFSPLQLGNQDVEPDVLGGAYEYLIKQFADTAGKKGGEFYTPKEVVQTMVRILDPKEGDRIDDPASGSGGMLVQVHYHIKNKRGDPRRLFLYGQEINVLTWAISKMNVFLHDMEAEILQGDTFSNPRFLEKDGSLSKFDIVLANPMWNQDGYKEAMEKDQYRRFIYGVASNSSADWGWIQHMLASLKPDGRMGIVLDNGVLFRSGMEGKIREKVLKEDLVECVIALPEKLFYNTGAPGCITILNKAKKGMRKGKVLFIYGGNGFEKLKNMNRLREEDIAKIAQTFREFKDVDKYASVVPLEKIKENDFNLSVTRYVDIFEEEKPVDIPKVLKDLESLESERTGIEGRLQGYLKELGY
ncbi:N-6 DNA methylase [candidate division TA06 bacterium]|nr:N-6 DNA methylase [candidate division TA06 bacterium]